MNKPEQCPKCKNYFTVSEIGGQFPGCKESEEIYCPHESVIICTHDVERWIRKFEQLL